MGKENKDQYESQFRRLHAPNNDSWLGDGPFEDWEGDSSCFCNTESPEAKSRPVTITDAIIGSAEVAARLGVTVKDGAFEDGGTRPTIAVRLSHVHWIIYRSGAGRGITCVRGSWAVVQFKDRQIIEVLEATNLEAFGRLVEEGAFA